MWPISPASMRRLGRLPFLDGVDRQQLEEVAGLRFEVTRELAAGARFGISQMDWALADTGTLVQDATAIDKRLVSSLPTIHIALLRPRACCPTCPPAEPGSTPNKQAISP